ncbi:hypothetical protein ACFL2X_04465 [Candidatus Latescibacterota bacterium]
MEHVVSLFRSSFNSHCPFNVLALILGGINIVLSIIYTIKLSVKNHSDKIREMENGINIILFLSLCMSLSVFFQPFYGIYRALGSLGRSGTDDPFVAIEGIMQAFTPFIYIGFVCSFNLICWFFLRAYHRLKVKRFSKNE